MILAEKFILAQVIGGLYCAVINQITEQKVPDTNPYKIHFVTSVTVRKYSPFSACKTEDVTKSLNSRSMALLGNKT